MVKVKTSRYVAYSPVSREHRGKPFLDLVNSESWKNFIVENLANYEYKIAVVPVTMEYRPDVISFSIYGTEKLWWLICAANGIIDPNTELVAGKQIRIPII